MASNGYFPLKGTLAYKILCAVHPQPEPVTRDWLEQHLLVKPTPLNKTVTLLVVGGWLLPVGDAPVGYQATDKASEFLSAGRQPWEDEEHRAWMRNFRQRYYDRVIRNP